MRSRLAGRLLTGPWAFFMAGVVDFTAYAIASLRRPSGGGARSERSV